MRLWLMSASWSLNPKPKCCPTRYRPSYLTSSFVGKKLLNVFHQSTSYAQLTLRKEYCQEPLVAKRTLCARYSWSVPSRLVDYLRYRPSGLCKSTCTICLVKGCVEACAIFVMQKYYATSLRTSCVWKIFGFWNDFDSSKYFFEGSHEEKKTCFGPGLCLTFV
ncbi:hypothetical protein RRG08_043025 [Elysia crispata]|uniref:Uncharacterized protein n=1 Tax=Elysia crispata TaxID=231223 RepID=A0AAE0XY86_9GAST|nr:hypothetical protein RRG08_043025 [Elysia crispata]